MGTARQACAQRMRRTSNAEDSRLTSLLGTPLPGLLGHFAQERFRISGVWDTSGYRRCSSVFKAAEDRENCEG